MKQLSSLGRALLAVAVLAVPSLVAAQTVTCALTSPCGGPPACIGGCSGPIAIQNASNAPCNAPVPGGGGVNLIGTEFENTCCNFTGGGCSVKVPPLRFWKYNAFKNANSGCQKVDDPAAPFMCNGKLDFGIGTANGHWFFFQAGWLGPMIDGCVAPTPPLRTVAEISFVDSAKEGSTAHTSYYMVASVDDDGSGNGYDFDRIKGSLTGCQANEIPVVELPALTITTPAVGACIGGTRVKATTANANAQYFNVQVNLANSSADYYTEVGLKDPATQLIAGTQIVYSKVVGAANEPKNSDAALGGWKPVRDPVDPTKALAFVPYGAVNPVTVSLPVTAATDDFYLATRLVYTDLTENPGTVFDPTTSGPLVVSKVSKHCGPVFFQAGVTTAVTYESVKAERTPTGVKVSWQTSMEDDTNGFVIQRAEKSAAGEAAPVTVGKPVPNVAAYHPYSLEDSSADPYQTYVYYVQELVSQGWGTRSAGVEVPGLARPAQTGVGGGRSRGVRRQQH